MNTSSPRRKCLIQPKRCNSRKSTVLRVEKTTSLNILISFILSLQPASARKIDICSFSDIPALFQDHPGRIKLQPNPAQVQRSAIMSLHAWLASWFFMMQFDLYLSDYRHNENKSMTFISTCLPLADWGFSAIGLAYHLWSSHFPRQNSGNLFRRAQELQHTYTLSFHASEPYALGGPQPHQHTQTHAQQAHWQTYLQQVWIRQSLFP